MTSGIRWRLPEDAPAAYPFVKRFIDAWFCDPEVRTDFPTDPRGVLDRLGLDLDPTEMGRLVSPNEIDRLTNPEAIDERALGDDLVSAWRRYAIRRYRAVRIERDARTPRRPGLAVWRARQIARLRFELRPSSADQIRHIPFAFELTAGCSGRCWFCGVSARPLEGVFERTPEHVALFRGLLDHLVDLYGPESASDGILYWATDPIDHPEYEAFVDDFVDRVGTAPATVTALAGRRPERAAAILRALARHPARTHRFSLLSRRDYRTIVERFDPESLACVELLPQYRADLGLKFDVGRARERRRATGGEIPAGGSGTIACLSGFIIDLVARTIRVATPCNASDERPDGVHESGLFHFKDLPEARRIVDQLAEGLEVDVTSSAATFHRTPGVTFLDVEDTGVTRIGSAHHAVRTRLPIRGEALDRGLAANGTVESLAATLAAEAGATPLEAIEILRILIDCGALRARLAEERLPETVPLGIPETKPEPPAG